MDDNPEIERLWAFATIEQALADINNFGEDPDLKQSVVDLALEYGLVTDYTSMLVVEDAVFATYPIARTNRARLQTESEAREKRAQQAPVSRRADTAKPMYRLARPSLGGGSLDVLFALACVWLMLISGKQKPTHKEV